MIRWTVVAALVWSLGIVMASPPAARAQGYDVTFLAFPGAIDTFARGINQQGIVVGGYGLPGAPFRGFIYDDGSFADLVVPGATHDTQAWAINGAGHIVGRFQPDGQDVKGFLYDGTFTTIDFPGAARTEALGINERGQVVGAYSSDATHGFLYSKGTFFAIDVPGSRATIVFDINSKGDFVGVYDDDLRRHGFVYRHGAYEEVSVPGSNETVPTSINGAGEIAGYATDIGGKTVGFILSHGTFVLLDLSEATRSTRIFRLNERGQVVGDIDLGVRGFVATPIHR
jgi:probable HAF family extracellular repeat protein